MDQETSLLSCLFPGRFFMKEMLHLFCWIFKVKYNIFNGRGEGLLFQAISLKLQVI